MAEDGGDSTWIAKDKLGQRNGNFTRKFLKNVLVDIVQLPKEETENNNKHYLNFLRWIFYQRVKDISIFFPQSTKKTNRRCSDM